MKRRVLSMLIAVCLVLAMAPVGVFATEAGDIVILFENDVHCNIDGYAKLAAIKAEEQANTEHVSVVSCGDFAQGGSIGAVSKGEYIVKIMNGVGYDVITPGNHEFDFGIPRLKELTDMLDAKVVSCNFFDHSTSRTFFDPYTIVSYGDVDVAYIGITTPETISSSTPTFFMDGNGSFLYDFSAEALYEMVQDSITYAQKDGAEYIVALTHIGSEYVTQGWSIQDVVANTEGIDVVLDGHSHSVVEGTYLTDEDGNQVLMASTGTAFANIGKLTISADGAINTELIPVEEYEKIDAEVEKIINQVKEEYNAFGQHVVGESEVLLTTLDANGNRAVRNSETNMGDFCADAFRVVLGTDIGISNGGGIRADIAIGEITNHNALSVFPWDNKVCAVKVAGQTVLDMLEMSVCEYPSESGGFLQVSGISFDVDALVATPVQLDADGLLTGIDGERRVKNVKVNGEALDPAKEYTIGGTKYILTDLGDGYTIFAGAQMVKDTMTSDVEVLKEYIEKHLGGVIGEEYATVQNRINIIRPEYEYIPLRKTFEAKGYEVIWTDAEPNTIYVKNGEKTVVFIADTNVITCNGSSYNSAKAAYIEEGVTYISSDCVTLCENLYR